MNIAVCDDEPVFVNEIVSLIKKQEMYDEFMSIDSYFSGEDLLKSIIQGKKYDLFFLDIMLDKMNGINIVEQLAEYDSIFVLISSSHSYVAKAFNLQVSQYLFKPIIEKDFAETFNRCLQIYMGKQQILTVTVDNLEYALSLKRVVYFESDRRKVRAIYDDNQIFEFYEKLDSLEEQFNKQQVRNMLRVHRSYIINLDYCVGLTDKTIHLQKKDGKRDYIRISARKEREVKRIINLYLTMKI